MTWVMVVFVVLVFAILIGMIFIEKKKNKDVEDIKKNLKDLYELNELRKKLQSHSSAVIEIRCLDTDSIFYREPS